MINPITTYLLCNSPILSQLNQQSGDAPTPITESSSAIVHSASGLLAWQAAAVFVAGVLLGTLFTAAIHRPRVAKFTARLFSVLAMGAGGGLLTWAIITFVNNADFRAPFGLRIVTSPVEGIGWGAGLLAASILALVLSFVGGDRSRSSDSHRMT